MRRPAWKEYCLPDGTVLLDDLGVTLSGLEREDIPPQAAERIEGYYAGRGALYDLDAELERAYADYAGGGGGLYRLYRRAGDARDGSERKLCKLNDEADALRAGQPGGCDRPRASPLNLATGEPR